MKIAVIGAKGLPPKQGGIEHYCAEVYPRIVTKGHHVDLFAQSTYTDLPWYYKYDFEGVQVISLPSVDLPGVSAFSSSAIGALSARFKREAYKIVHFHALGPSLFTWLPRLASSKSKVVVTCQGLDWQRAKWGKFQRRMIHLGEQAAVKYAHEIIVVSRDLQDYFQQTYQRTTTYIPNAPAEYGESDPNMRYVYSQGLSPKKYILFLGRLVPEKRPDLLISAYQKLQNPEWKLVFVGENSNTPSYKAKLHDLAANNPDILFLGELRGSRLAEVVRSAGLFALPSDLEGLPLAMLEAMLQGIAVVASNIPPHQQLLEEGRGLLFKPSDVKSCTEALCLAIKDTDKMTTMAKMAQFHVKQNYSWDRVVKDNLSIYENLSMSSGVVQLRA